MSVNVMEMNNDVLQLYYNPKARLIASDVLETQNSISSQISLSPRSGSYLSDSYLDDGDEFSHHARYDDDNHRKHYQDPYDMDYDDYRYRYNRSSSEYASSDREVYNRTDEDYQIINKSVPSAVKSELTLRAEPSSIRNPQYRFVRGMVDDHKLKAMIEQQTADTVPMSLIEAFDLRAKLEQEKIGKNLHEVNIYEFPRTFEIDSDSIINNRPDNDLINALICLQMAEKINGIESNSNNERSEQSQKDNRQNQAVERTKSGGIQLQKFSSKKHFLPGCGSFKPLEIVSYMGITRDSSMLDI